MMLSRKGLIKECNFVNFFYKFLNLLALPPVTTTEPDGNSQKLQTLVVVDKDAVVSWDSLRAVSFFLSSSLNWLKMNFSSQYQYIFQQECDEKK